MSGARSQYPTFGASDPNAELIAGIWLLYGSVAGVYQVDLTFVDIAGLHAPARSLACSFIELMPQVNPPRRRSTECKSVSAPHVFTCLS